MNPGWWWLLPWDLSPTVLAATVLAAWRFWHHGAGLPAWRRACFWLGLAMLYGSLQSGIDYYAGHAFFMHRVQHMFLHHMGPFLIALGLPEAWARWRGWRMFPWLSAALFNGLVLFWLLPAIHLPAMLDARLYRAMNWSMVINGLMFWITVLRATSLGPGRRIGMLVAIIPVQIAIGALIFLSSNDLFPVYALCGRAFGLSALEDQQIGGLILWIHGAMMSAAGLLLVVRPTLTDSRARA